jgi:hypothetical protein
MAEDFPEDKYGYKPATNMRSFAERLIHAASANYFFTNSDLGQKLPGDEDPPRAQFKNKAAVVEYVKKSFAAGVAAIKSRATVGSPMRSLIPSVMTIRSTRAKRRFDLAIWPTI